MAEIANTLLASLIRQREMQASEQRANTQGALGIAGKSASEQLAWEMAQEQQKKEMARKSGYSRTLAGQLPIAGSPYTAESQLGAEEAGGQMAEEGRKYGSAREVAQIESGGRLAVATIKAGQSRLTDFDKRDLEAQKTALNAELEDYKLKQALLIENNKEVQGAIRTFGRDPQEIEHSAIQEKLMREMQTHESNIRIMQRLIGTAGYVDPKARNAAIQSVTKQSNVAGAVTPPPTSGPGDTGPY